MTTLEPVPTEQPLEQPPEQPSSSFPSSEQIHRTMRFSTLEGSITQIFINWTTGSVLTGLMLHYGATAFELAMVASVPLLAQSASPFAAYLAGVFGRRKRLMILFALIGRGCWILAAFLPWLGVPDAIKPFFLVMLVAFSSVFQAATGTLWAGLMGDLVPGEERGRYFGYRAGLSGVVGMLGNLGAGYLLDRLEAPLNFQVVLFISVGLALIGIALYATHVEPPPPPLQNMKKTLLEPWQDLNFRRLLRFALFWQASVFLAAPFVFTYFITELKLSFTQIALWSVVGATCALFTNALWGQVADKVGNKAVVQIGTFLAGSLMPASWILAGVTGNINFVWLSAVFDALAWGAVNPALFNLAVVSAKPESRLSFIAAFSLATGVAGFLGGLASGPLLELFRSWFIGGTAWTGYHMLFAVSGGLRMMAWVLVRPIQETHAWRARDVLREVRRWRNSGFPWHT